jgi:phenylpyruvate tautomerase PptA (4-oxalocrotonate tautomerase family)
MPLVRIDTIEGRGDATLAAIGDAVHQALVECFSVPERDRFQVITEHRRDRLIYNRAYLGVDRTDEIVLVQVFLSTGRSDELKTAFYARTAQLIDEHAQMRPEDVFITLVENTRADWSFGSGVAQYLTLPRDQWK